MEHVKILEEYGLFDARVPRYTSYPPANRFEPDLGRKYQQGWLEDLSPKTPVSIYVHIPFCRRLCWFCACRTQGTRTLKPVDDYLYDVIAEIAHVAQIVPKGLPMARLHLGGGTPTLLNVAQMRRLLDAVFRAFAPASGFEFSVEIDPTEADLAVIDELGQWGMNRASIGVQDFDPRVQRAIGREQSFEATQQVVDAVRNRGTRSLNMDLLYGLPFQTSDTLLATLEKICALTPDRLALYGYAHVPHMSKRQVMIPGDALPSAQQRFSSSDVAQDLLTTRGYTHLGIDHFALPHDSLAKAAAKGKIRRNFQGYTDDPCGTLLGFGASAISTFAQGYTQNAVATVAYRARVQAGGLAAHKGYALSERDKVLSDLIDMIMCRGHIELPQVIHRHPDQARDIEQIVTRTARHFAKATRLDHGRLSIRSGCQSLTRIIAAFMDQHLDNTQVHSAAI